MGYVTDAAMGQLVPVPGAVSHLHQPQAGAPYHSQVMDSKPRLRETAGNDTENRRQGNLSPHFTLLGQKRGRKGKITEFCFILPMDYILTTSWFLLVLVYFVEGIQQDIWKMPKNHGIWLIENLPFCVPWKKSSDGLLTNIPLPCPNSP